MTSAKMPPMPPRIATLDRDPRTGYPIPWNVLRRTTDTPDHPMPVFTINDDRRDFQAIREGRCALCGQSLGRYRWFTGGPRSAFDPHGWYLDPPNHRECAEFALATCPWLSAPKYLRRVDVTDASNLGTPLLIDHSQDHTRPDVFVSICGAPGIEINPRSDRLPIPPYVRPVRPLTLWQAWRHGVRLSRAEAVARVQQALPGWQEPQGLDYVEVG